MPWPRRKPTTWPDSWGSKLTEQHYDVIVVGGGSAGIAAAVGASRSGARTLLVERYGFLGGAATSSNVLAYCGFWTSAAKPIMGVRGVGASVLEALDALGANAKPQRNRTGNWIVMIDPEAVKHALDKVVADAGVDVLTHTRLVQASASKGVLQAVTLQDHAGPRQYSANAFVDASGDADLVRLAGGSVEDRDKSIDERAPASFPVRIGGVGDGTWDRDEVANCLDGINVEYADARIRTGGGGLFKLHDSGDLWWLGIDMLTDGLTGESLTRAETVGRDLAWRSVARLKQAVPAFEHAYIVATGPQAGIRESGPARPLAAISGDDVLNGTLRDDGIACGCWPSEVHKGLSGATYRPIGGEGYYHVPLDSLRQRELENVWLGGRVIGCADDIAYGSLRVMGTAFATGHAAGVAAAIGAELSGNVEVAKVRERLVDQGAFL